MIVVRDPIEVPRNRSFEILRRRINASRPGFELGKPHRASRILIICAARYAAHRLPVEHGPSRQKLLCDLGDAARKELCGADIGSWRNDVAALIRVGLAGPKRV
jgi:hypothetical protein